jgi:hypothetical protein
MEAGNLLLEAFMEAGVPTWKVREKTSDPLKWNMIAEGTADSFEAAKAAALYEAETALRWTCPALVERHWLIWRPFFRTEPGL